jgi:hypothetical protein
MPVVVDECSRCLRGDSGVFKVPEIRSRLLRWLRYARGRPAVPVVRSRRLRDALG